MKIFDKGDFWIETIIVPRQAVAAGSSNSINHSLSKPGRFVGAAACIDAQTNTVTILTELSVVVRNEPNTELTYGLSVTNIRVLLVNNHGSAQTFGAKVLIFMRT